jgi:hypothetical protein
MRSGAMKKHDLPVNAMLWAAAILAAAVVNAPHFFSLILLPMLAVSSQLSLGKRACRQRSDIS